ncbi:MAG TPA: histidine--tRNA ligase [Mycobacteriales bacterium]|jgi:histidyl-tRNA synthetase|nr:histidine--tRNA ligase [Mycobacteriales bacterium]
MDRPLIEPRTLRGFADLTPALALHRRRLLRVAEDTFASFGYDPIQTPALEHADVLKGKGGSESDKQMFEFDDQGGRRVALRFDLTVPLARFAAQHTELRPPLRLYQVGYVWRGERPQKGRYREFFQCDADIIGETGPSGDAEILTMFATALSRMDVGPVLLRVNDRRVLNGLLADLGLLDRAVPVLRAIDKIDKVGTDAVRAELAGSGVDGAAADRVLGFAAARGETDEQTFAAVGELLSAGGAGRAALDELRRTVELAVAAGAPEDALRVDPGIARGLDYYTGLVFETTLLAAPDIGSVCSGGRYDDLAGLFTRQRLPGVGASIGLSRLLAALEGTGRLGAGRERPLAVVTNGRDDDLRTLLGVAARLRATGVLDAEVYPTAVKHATQMKYADTRGARFVVTLDRDGSVSVKDLRGGERWSAGVEDVAVLLAKALAAAD